MQGKEGGKENTNQTIKYDKIQKENREKTCMGKEDKGTEGTRQSDRAGYRGNEREGH